MALGFLFPFFSPPAPAVFGVFGPRPPFPRLAAPAAWAALAPGCLLLVCLSLWGGAVTPGAGRLTRCRDFGVRGLDRLDSQSLLRRLGKGAGRLGGSR